MHYPIGHPRVLVGRDGELGALEHVLEEADAGGRFAVMLSGEPGIGKTALLAETLDRGRTHGFKALSGRAAEFERDLPYALFAGILDDCAEQLQDGEASPMPDGDLARLATAFPALGTPERSARPQSARRDERHRLLSALHRLLEVLAGDRPLLVGLDDLHWADASSIDLVCRLLHRGLIDRSVLLLAVRPGPREARLVAAFGDAERRGQARRIELGPLSAADANRLMGPDVDLSLRESLYRESGGNPLYLEQLAGAAGRRRSRPPEGLGPPETRIPAAVGAAIRAELGELCDSARRLLYGAALVGDPFDPELAAEIAEISEPDALRDLDDLLQHDLVRITGSPRRFRFRHPIVRHAVYEAVGAGWRLRAHGRAAAALAARGVPAMLRAPHVEQSARVGDLTAASLLVQAGQELMWRAPGSAERWFDAALRIMPEGDENVELRVGLVAQRAAALGLADRLDESRDELRRFLELAPDEPSEQRLHAVVLAAIFDDLLGAYDAARDLLFDELAKLEDRAGGGAAALKREVACTYFLAADWPNAREWARDAIATERAGMVGVGSFAILALAEYGLGNSGEAQHSLSQAIKLFDGLTDEEIATHPPGTAAYLGTAEVVSERFTDAIRHAKRTISISQAAGQRYLTVAMRVVQGLAFGYTGRIADLTRCADSAAEEALLSTGEVTLSLAMTIRSWAALMAGDLSAALRYGEHGAGVAAASTNPFLGVARIQLADVLVELGEADRGRELLIDERGELEPSPLSIAFEAMAWEVVSRAELARGDLQRAEDFAQRSLRAARRIGLNLPDAFARRALAVVALERGDAESCLVHATASTAAAKRAHSHVEAARSRILVGMALAAVGDRTSAVATLQSTHRELATRGASLYRDQAACALRRLGRAVPRAPTTTRNGKPDPLGLTDREYEVMELVAAGRANREIAETLVLSVRTVDRHVAGIFEKLDVHSRAAATSAFERGRAPAPRQVG